MKSVLVIAAHPDDEILGLGGTLKKHVNEGDDVNCIILGEGLTSRKDKRCDTQYIKINSLQADAKRSGEIIGFKKMVFEKLPDNRFDSVDLLEVIKCVEKHIESFNPDIIYTHFYGDRNIDHQITFEAVMTACRPLGENKVTEIYSFETPSSTEWGVPGNNKVFQPNVFVDIDGTINDKLEAMKCYVSELKEYPHPRSLKSLETIAERWGTVVSKKYVEAFELIRMIK